MENIPDYVMTLSSTLVFNIKQVQYFVLPKTLVERKDISKEQNDQPIDDSKSINVQQQDAQNIAADESIYSHEHYTCVKDDQKADAIAWAFSNKDEFVRIPFRFEKLGDDELRVNITYTGLCHSDVMTGRSHWGPAKYPITPGHEVVGIVAQVGKNVKNFNVGERIAYGPARDSCDSCRNCQKGYDNICNVVEAGKKGLYGEYWGGYATAIQQPAKWAFKLPESLPSDRTPPILCAGVTVYAPLARYVKHGSKVGIIGIGGLGHMAVQYARKMGCHVTALSSTKGKEDLLKNELGAHEVISSIDPEELKKAAQRFDVIINTLTVANNEIFGLYLQLVAPNGTFVQVGAPPIEEGLNIKAFQLIMNNINFAGSLVGSRRETKACLNFSALHNILPMCEFFGFEDFPKALDTLENGRPKFRCVVKVEEWSKKNGFFKN